MVFGLAAFEAVAGPVTVVDIGAKGLLSCEPCLPSESELLNSEEQPWKQTLPVHIDVPVV